MFGKFHVFNKELGPRYCVELLVETVVSPTANTKCPKKRFIFKANIAYICDINDDIDNNIDRFRTNILILSIY